MKIQVRYFASLRETIGVASEVVDTACEDVAGLRQQLMARGEAHAECLAAGRPVRVAVNQVMANDATLLSGDCEVAFFPPVTGG
ncbi:molybdopterin converting factor subunit 1 [Limnohabitans sp. T6-20]|uniref:molybdopterin converting factor subunit 1 n=1 Tax=Limnohabitans sp. T6-20 TaxID=1100725 RepID=UPI000D379312|nr:molybdopterin converting factor subunit 1 [Limnohabitans sp. T6-20]PUE10368.1 molybdopterin converting factor subunit 1 [Limnohabitans sp. T6-20]